MAFVYHIYKTGDTLDDGYVGVTRDIDNRKRDHFNKLEKHKHQNLKLQEAYDSNIYTFRVILESSEEFCYYIENKLRPSYNMGLNISIGGRLPPIVTNPEYIEKGLQTKIERYGRNWSPKQEEFSKISIEDGSHPLIKKNRVGMIIGNEFTSEYSSNLAKHRASNGELPSQISSKNGTHHWFGENNSKEVSKRNIENFTGTVTVTNKRGISSRITQEQYINQQISNNKEDWEYVGIASKEAKQRRSI